MWCDLIDQELNGVLRLAESGMACDLENACVYMISFSVVPEESNADTGSRAEACVSTAPVTDALQKVGVCVHMWAGHACNQ